MENFIIEEFGMYKIFLYDQNTQGHADYSIQFKIPSGRVIMKFWDGSVPKNRTKGEGTPHITFYVNHDRSKYPIFVDLLRYEKPIFFYYNFSDGTTYLTTTDEPVGEQEPSDD